MATTDPLFNCFLLCGLPRSGLLPVSLWEDTDNAAASDGASVASPTPASPIADSAISFRSFTKLQRRSEGGGGDSGGSAPQRMQRKHHPFREAFAAALHDVFPDPPGGTFAPSGVPASVAGLCLPEGARLRQPYRTDPPPVPEYCVPVLSDASGGRFFLHTLIVWEELTEQQLACVDRTVFQLPGPPSAHGPILGPRAMVLVSPLMLPAARQALVQLYRLSFASSECPWERVVHALLGVPVPPLGGLSVRHSIGDEELAFWRPPANRRAAADNLEIPLKLLLKALPRDQLLLAFRCMLAGRSIVLVCSSVLALTHAAEALVALQYPFEFPGVYAPVLPSPPSAGALLRFPGLMLLGVRIDRFRHIIQRTPGGARGALAAGLTIVNLDEGRVVLPGTATAWSAPPEVCTKTGRAKKLPALPARAEAKLRTCLADHGSLFESRPPGWAEEVLPRYGDAFSFGPPAGHGGLAASRRTHHRKPIDLGEVRAGFLRVFTSLLRDYRSFIRFEAARSSFGGSSLLSSSPAAAASPASAQAPLVGGTSGQTSPSPRASAAGATEADSGGVCSPSLGSELERISGAAAPVPSPEAGQPRGAVLPSNGSERLPMVRHRPPRPLRMVAFFDKEGFISSHYMGAEAWPILNEVLESQAFAQFIQLRARPPRGPGTDAARADILFFDESIFAKRDRSTWRRIRGNKTQTPFLDDSRFRHVSVVVAPGPCLDDLPEVPAEATPTAPAGVWSAAPLPTHFRTSLLAPTVRLSTAAPVVAHNGASSSHRQAAPTTPSRPVGRDGAPEPSLLPAALQAIAAQGAAALAEGALARPSAAPAAHAGLVTPSRGAAPEGLVPDQEAQWQLRVVEAGSEELALAGDGVPLPEGGRQLVWEAWMEWNAAAARRLASLRPVPRAALQELLDDWLSGLLAATGLLPPPNCKIGHIALGHRRAWLGLSRSGVVLAPPKGSAAAEPLAANGSTCIRKAAEDGRPPLTGGFLAAPVDDEEASLPPVAPLAGLLGDAADQLPGEGEGASVARAGDPVPLATGGLSDLPSARLTPAAQPQSLAGTPLEVAATGLADDEDTALRCLVSVVSPRLGGSTLDWALDAFLEACVAGGEAWRAVVALELLGALGMLPDAGTIVDLMELSGGDAPLLARLSELLADASSCPASPVASSSSRGNPPNPPSRPASESPLQRRLSAFGNIFSRISGQRRGSVSGLAAAAAKPEQPPTLATAVELDAAQVEALAGACSRLPALPDAPVAYVDSAEAFARARHAIESAAGSGRPPASAPAVVLPSCPGCGRPLTETELRLGLHAAASLDSQVDCQGCRHTRAAMLDRCGSEAGTGRASRAGSPAGRDAAQSDALSLPGEAGERRGQQLQVEAPERLLRQLRLALRSRDGKPGAWPETPMSVGLPDGGPSPDSVEPGLWLNLARYAYGEGLPLRALRLPVGSGYMGSSPGVAGSAAGGSDIPSLARAVRVLCKALCEAESEE